MVIDDVLNSEDLDLALSDYFHQLEFCRDQNKFTQLTAKPELNWLDINKEMIVVLAGLIQFWSIRKNFIAPDWIYDNSLRLDNEWFGFSTLPSDRVLDFLLAPAYLRARNVFIYPDRLIPW